MYLRIYKKSTCILQFCPSLVGNDSVKRRGIEVIFKIYEQMLCGLCKGHPLPCIFIRYCKVNKWLPDKRKSSMRFSNFGSSRYTFQGFSSFQVNSSNHTLTAVVYWMQVNSNIMLVSAIKLALSKWSMQDSNSNHLNSSLQLDQLS